MTAKFASIRLVYQTEYVVPDEEIATDNRVAKLIYRHDVLGIASEREVPQFHMFLGSVAGLYRLLMTLITLSFGPYITFISKVKWIKYMYTFVYEGDDKSEPHRFDVSGCYLPWLYVKNNSCVSWLFSCCAKSKREK